MGAWKTSVQEKNRDFLKRHPELEDARRREETWTEEQIVEWALSHIKVRVGLKGLVGDLYLKAEIAPT